MSKKRMRSCASCCRILNTDLMYYDWGEWNCNSSNLQNKAECEWISSFYNEIIPDFSNEQIAKDFFHAIIPSYFIQRWIVKAFNFPSKVTLDGFTIGNLEKLISLGKEDFINELNTMVSLGEIDKKGFRYSMGETYAEINKRVSKLDQKYNGLIEAVIE